MANELQMNIDANESCRCPRVIWQLVKSLINTLKLGTCSRCSCLPPINGSREALSPGERHGDTSSCLMD